MKTYDIVIAGAGSVGVPLSWQLAIRGLKVAVIDQEPSWGRGQNRAAIGGLRATHSDAAKIRICLEAIKIVSTMREEHGFDIEWHKGGYLYVAYDEATRASFMNLLKLQKKAGLDIDWVGPDVVQRLSPGINREGLLGGTFSPGDGFASPLMAGTAYHRLAMDSGVDFFFNTRIESVNMEGDKVASLSAGGEIWSAPLFINAAGAEAADLASLAGVDIPIHPDCHEAGVTEPVQRFMEPMVVDIRPDSESGNYYFYQAGTGQVVFCITPRPQIWGRDKGSTSSFLPLCVRRMLELYPRLRNLRVRRTWRGMYPMTPDGLPIIGYPEKARNFLQAVGMCGQGFMMGPGLGKILAESIVSGGDFSRPAGSTDFGFVFDELACTRGFDHVELLK
ncbi:MAG TPA: FAD-dependent oxidoreductase [Rectinemataceae bacterium]|nr:FAD-dependent oxidoreductase [Rectinemataceae bacterium]